MSRNEAAIAMYGGMMGAYLSAEVPAIDRETRELLREAIHWLQGNNPLIQLHGLGLGESDIIQMDGENINQQMNLRFPRAVISEEVNDNSMSMEPPLPMAYPDIIMNPFQFSREVRNEDHRNHRLPIGVVESYGGSERRGELGIRSREIFSVCHGDPNLEALLFATLYPNGRGHWQYTRPEVRKVNL